MTKAFTRKHSQAQVRDLPLFKFAATQERRLQHLGCTENTLRFRNGLSRPRAKLIAELQGYGGEDGST